MDHAQRMYPPNPSLEALPYPVGLPDQEIPPYATGVMDVDLGAVQKNYMTLKGLIHPQVDLIPVVKANAYGMGMEPVAQALWAYGAHAFFVADLNEAVQLRVVLPESQIFVMAGLWEGVEKLFEAQNLTPVLIDRYQVRVWQKHAASVGRRLPALLHVDTGMRRTGVPMSDVKALAQESRPWEGLELQMVMSHLACAADPDHLMNMKQLRLFKEMAPLFPGVPLSLSASAGIFMGPAYHFQVVRPGMLLYGLRPNAMDIPIQLNSCLRVAVRVLQIQEAEAGETVGYSATYRFGKRSRIATLMLGHADGYLRPLSNQGSVMIAGHLAPLVGRVSMDLVTVDVTHIPESLVYPGQWADIVNDQINVQEVAKNAHTIAHEVLVRLGPRYQRRYYL